MHHGDCPLDALDALKQPGDRIARLFLVPCVNGITP
jgi:hypothetical protein